MFASVVIVNVDSFAESLRLKIMQLILNMFF